MKQKQRGNEVQSMFSSSTSSSWLWARRLIGLLASSMCLTGAIYTLWSTHDVLVFLLLIGVATDRIPIWRAIGRVEPGYQEKQEKAENESRQR